MKIKCTAKSVKSTLIARFHVSNQLLKKCLAILNSFDTDQIRAILLKFTIAGRMFKLEVGHKWRLISKDRLTWELVSHEEYNNLMKIK